MLVKPEERETTISHNTVEKIVAPQKDGFGVVHLAIRQVIDKRLDQEIIFTEGEVRKLQEVLNKQFPVKDGEREDAHTERTYRYLVVETRRVEQRKRRIILHWCEDWDQVLEALREADEFWDEDVDPDLEEVIKIIPYDHTISPLLIPYDHTISPLPSLTGKDEEQ